MEQLNSLYNTTNITDYCPTWIPKDIQTGDHSTVLRMVYGDLATPASEAAMQKLCNVLMTNPWKEDTCPQGMTNPTEYHLSLLSPHAAPPYCNYTHPIPENMPNGALDGIFNVIQMVALAGCALGKKKICASGVPIAIIQKAISEIASGGYRTTNEKIWNILPEAGKAVYDSMTTYKIFTSLGNQLRPFMPNFVLNGADFALGLI